MVGDIIAITLLVLAVVCSIVLIYRRATGKAGCSCGGASSCNGACSHGGISMDDEACSCGGASSRGGARPCGDASACAACACSLSYRAPSRGMSASSSSSEVRHE